MIDVDAVATVARNYLRDFPKFFQTTFSVVGRTFELGHPNIDSDSMYIAYVPSGATSASVIPLGGYSLDARNGILRLLSSTAQNSSLLVEGYYYERLLPADLTFYSQMAINLNTHNLEDISVPAAAVVDVIGISALVEALWGLTTEYSRDIDVMTSESIHIPASQRFRMVQSMLQYWMGEYEKRARALNIGLERIEVFTLRRTSRTTNRLVPVYKAREIGDHSPIERVWPRIDSGELPIEEPADKLRDDVFIDGDLPTSTNTSMDAMYY